MSFIVDWLLQPLSLIVLFSCLGLIATLVFGSLKVQLPIALLVLLVWISSAPLSANHFIGFVEQKAEGSQCGRVGENSPVVVLGGGMNAYVQSNSPYDVLTKETLQRTLIASELNTNLNRYYLLGGGATTRKISDYMSQVLVRHGVLEEQIFVDTKSLSTYENALALESLLPPSNKSALILVTSAYHLSRAERTFRSQGYDVCGVGVGALYAPSAGWVGLLPHIDALNKTTLAWREVIARQWYRYQYDV